MPAVTSSIMRKRTVVGAGKPKKLGVMKLSEQAEKAAAAGAAVEDHSEGAPATPSPTVTSKVSEVVSPPTPEVSAPPAASSSGGYAHRDLKAKHLSPPKKLSMQDWDEWGLASTVSTLNSVVTNLTSETDATGKTPGSKWKLAARGNGGSNSDTPSKFSVESIVGAGVSQGIDAINVVGRAAMYLGTAIDNAIEGTATIVQNVSKRADHIAHRVASPSGTPRTSPGKDFTYKPDEWNFSDENAVPSFSLNAVSRGGSVGRILAALSPNSRAVPGAKGSIRTPASPVKRSPVKAARSPSKAVLGRAATAAGAVVGPKSPLKRGSSRDAGFDWGWSSASPTKEQTSRAVESAVAQFRRELEASNAEKEALRDAMGELQKDLHETKQNYANLRKQNLGLQKRAVAREVCGEASDPLAEQMRLQLETLVREKARLAQENAALKRETESLHELLMYSNMASMAEAMYSPGGVLGHIMHPEPEKVEEEVGTDSVDEEDISGDEEMEMAMLDGAESSPVLGSRVAASEGEEIEEEGEGVEEIGVTITAASQEKSDKEADEDDLARLEEALIGKAADDADAIEEATAEAENSATPAEEEEVVAHAEEAIAEVVVEAPIIVEEAAADVVEEVAAVVVEDSAPAEEEAAAAPAEDNAEVVVEAPIIVEEAAAGVVEEVAAVAVEDSAPAEKEEAAAPDVVEEITTVVEKVAAEPVAVAPVVEEPTKKSSKKAKKGKKGRK